MARMRTVPMRMSPTGYARSSNLVVELDSQTARSPKPQAVEVRAMATIRPSNQMRQRADVPRASPQKARMPATANGTADRNPASAKDGYGTVTPSPTSSIDQTTPPPPP